MAGGIVWFELPAQDTARATGFYRDLFGWSFQPWEGPFEYHMTSDATPGGAVYPVQGGEKGPIVYFGVQDVDAAIARVRELGGEAQEKQEIPSIGVFARCTDTEGNAFSVFQPAA